MINCINPQCKSRFSHSDSCECGTSILLNDRFRVLDRIGNSSHVYEVFRAEDTRENNQIVAIKTLSDSSNKNYRNYFCREQGILRNSNYCCLPKWVDEGDEDSVLSRPKILYTVMEFIDGQNLSQWLTTENKNKLSQERKAWEWLKNITNTLTYLHDRNYLHLDLKPDNIILREDSNPEQLVLIDFAIDGSRGTERYTAPERKNGVKNTPMVDFFSLGQTFVYLTTGDEPKPVEDGNNWADRTDFSLSPLIEVINWMREEDPVNRPQTTYDILYAINILSKQNQTRDNAKKLIKKISNPTQEDEGLRLQLAEKNRQIEEQAKSIKINQFSTSTAIVASILGAIAIIGSVSMYNFYRDSQDSLGIAETKNKDLIAKVKSQKEIIAQHVKVDELISSGEKNLNAFSNNTLLGNGSKFKKEAIDLFKKAEDDKNNPELYKRSFEKFREIYIEYQRTGGKVLDPEIPIYLNNAKVRYLSSKNKSKKLYKIAVPCPVDDETGQHILLGVALKQQLLLNNNNNKPAQNVVKIEPSIYLEVIIAHDFNIPTTSEKIAKQLVNINKIFGVVGHYSTEATQSALKTYSDAGLAVVSPTASGSGIAKDYSNVFNRIISSTDVEAGSWLKFLESHSFFNDSSKLKIKVFYKHDKTATKYLGFSEDLFQLFERKLSKYIKIDRTKDIFDLSDFNQKSLKEFIRKIDSENTLIVLIPNGKNLEDGVFDASLQVLDELRNKKDKIKYILGSNPLFSVHNVSSGRLNEWSDRLMVAVDWHSECSRKTSPFVPNLSAFLNGGELDRRSAASYEAIQVLFNLFENNQANTRKSIAEGLKKIKDRPEDKKIVSEVHPSKKISFKNNGDRIEITERIIVTPQILRNEKKEAIGTLFTEANKVCSN